MPGKNKKKISPSETPKSRGKKENKTLKEKPEDATLKQEIFCQEWVDTIGNGTVAAIKAFDIKDKELIDQELPAKPKERKEIKKWKAEVEDIKKRKRRMFSTAAAMASEYLRKPNIIKRIDDILEERGFNDDAVKREHFKLISGSKDEVRVRAIDSYYRLKGKYIDRTEHSGLNGGPIQVKYEKLSDEELLKLYEQRHKAK